MIYKIQSGGVILVVICNISGRSKVIKLCIVTRDLTKKAMYKETKVTVIFNFWKYFVCLLGHMHGTGPIGSPQV